jgi:hypothetical protein
MGLLTCCARLLGGHGLRVDGRFGRRQRRQCELFGHRVEHEFQSAHGAPINDPRPWRGVNRRVADGGDARRAFPRHIRFSGATASLLGGPAAWAEDCEHAHCALVRLLERPCRFGEQGFSAGEHLDRVAVAAGHQNAGEWLEIPKRLQNFGSHGESRSFGRSAAGQQMCAMVTEFFGLAFGNGRGEDDASRSGAGRSGNSRRRLTGNLSDQIARLAFILASHPAHPGRSALSPRETSEAPCPR